jgi:hypothetical protein
LIFNDYYSNTNDKTVYLQAGQIYPILAYYNEAGGYDFGIGFTDPNGNFITDFTNITKQSNNNPTRVPCFNAGTKILTDNGYKLVEELKKGDLVKTLLHGYKAVDMIGKRDIVHMADTTRIKDQLYKCSPSEYPELIEDLIITGCHSILIEEFEDNQREESIKLLGDIYITDDKYRLPACLDKKASVYEKTGIYTIYHFALENPDYYMNYAIYANGLLVETCSKRYLKEVSQMTII